jgi:hypothetical protein
VTVRGRRPSPRLSEVRQERSQVNAFNGFAVCCSGADRAFHLVAVPAGAHFPATGVRSDMPILRSKASARFAEHTVGAPPSEIPDEFKSCGGRHDNR